MPKKVDEIHDAIKRKNPNMKDSTAWAIAWSKYKEESLGELHKEICGKSERFKEAEELIPKTDVGSTDRGGAHIHSGENDQGLHSHTELEQQIKSLKSQLELLKQPL